MIITFRTQDGLNPFIMKAVVQKNSLNIFSDIMILIIIRIWTVKVSLKMIK